METLVANIPLTNSSLHHHSQTFIRNHCLTSLPECYYHFGRFVRGIF
uniref:Uncharacterized protein n=1 Tax=Rhizophora mucronata TaxID=61149 RepID=A0A2P2NV32_RHIMU